MESKELWRAFVREKFGGEVVDSTSLVRGVVDFLDEVCPTGKIVSYDALNDEVDMSALHDHFGESRLCLTRTPAQSMDLTLHPFDIGQLERHRYGFNQPVASAPLVADREVRAVLVPGLLFDRHGTRLGHGQGYYDRFLARMGPLVVTVGITKDLVLEEQLPAESHDVPMTHLATSRGVEPVSAPM